MATITLRIPDELNEALDRERRATGMSKSDLARAALLRFLAVSEFQRLRARLVRRAQTQGVHVDDDVFRMLGKA
jgi:predicted transcriptional regulator